MTFLRLVPKPDPDPNSDKDSSVIIAYGLIALLQFFVGLGIG